MEIVQNKNKICPKYFEKQTTYIIQLYFIYKNNVLSI